MNGNTPAKFGVRGVPTMIFFNNGKAVMAKVGALSKNQLLTFVNSIIP